MTISRVELQGQITRANDFATVKHNEDHHSQVMQSHIAESNDKAVEVRLHHVNDAEHAENRQKRFDAKEKGSNEYAGDGGQNRKKKEERDGRVILKAPEHGFDLKI
ncbi:MAG: hypothetical protein K6A38_00650 [Lachnospiraceae bacterium]|nr:hypothetical protein [Lachnospiraceae bacterium]